MSEEQKQALIEWLKPQIDELQNVSDEIPFGLDSDSAMHLNTIRVALAALTAQPVAWHVYQWRESPKGWDWYLTRAFASEPNNSDGWRSIALFTRPAPAANLADLVPDEMHPDHPKMRWVGMDELFPKIEGWNDCRAEMLRNIKEAK